MRFRIFGTHTPKPKRFDYKPRFYDEVAERHKRLEAQYGPFGSDPKHNKARIYEVFDTIRSRRKYPGRSAYSAGLRILIIFVVLCILVYVFLYTDMGHLIEKIQRTL